MNYKHYVLYLLRFLCIFPKNTLSAKDDVNLLTAFIKEFVGSNQCWQSHCRMAPLKGD